MQQLEDLLKWYAEYVPWPQYWRDCELVLQIDGNGEFTLVQIGEEGARGHYDSVTEEIETFKSLEELHQWLVSQKAQEALKKLS